MAEVAYSPGLVRQLSVVVMVRWQTFRNGLRSRSEKAHMFGGVAFGLFFGALILVASLGIGFAAFAFVRGRQWVDLSLILWGIFAFWQFAPVLTSAMNPGFDGRNLLRFPLRFSAFFLISAASGVADPFALAGILWHLAIGVGVSIARPDLRWWAALALTISVMMNLLFNRAVFAWLERVLAKRRTREIATAIFLLLFVCFQFSGLILQRWGPALRRAAENSATLRLSLPPSLAATIIEHAADGNLVATLGAVLLLTAYALVFGGLFAFRVRAQFTGEDLGESAAPLRRNFAAQRVPSAIPATGTLPSQNSSLAGSPAGIVSAPVAALFGKELRYFYRNSMLMMNVFMPLILILFFILTSSAPRRQGRPFSGLFGGSIAYPAAVAYIILLMMNLCPNNLAYEGQGLERLFLAPVEFSDVMLAKNLFHGALLATEALLALILVTATGHPPSLLIILATWAALPFATLIQLAVGNWLSLQYPRRFEFDVRRQRPSGMTSLISLGLYFTLMGILSGAALLCIWLAGLWLLPVVYLAMSAAALALYALILQGTSRQAIRQRDALLQQLSH